MLYMMSSLEKNTRTRILDATWRLMEQRQGVGVRMSDIAKAAGVSRQALYLHFESRVALLSATTKYVDQVKGLDERLQKVEMAVGAIAVLTTYIEVWGNYLPEIAGLSKALLATRETDEAADLAWQECMTCHRDGCERIVSALEHEQLLIGNWSHAEAVEILWTMLSFQTWDQLREESHWTNAQYINGTQTMLMRILTKQTA